MNAVDSSWLYWAGGLAFGLPFLLITLTEWHNYLARRQSALARPVNLLRNYIVPLAALLLLLVKVARVPAQFNSVRVLATVFGFVVLGEKVTPNLIGGAALIVAGVLLTLK